MFARQKASHRTFKKTGVAVILTVSGIDSKDISPEQLQDIIAKGTLGMTTALTEAPAPNTEAGQDLKGPFTRPLDLPLGWGEYVEKDEAEHRGSAFSADIYHICQSIAEFAAPYWEAAPEVQEMAVRHFLDTRFLPLLLGKVKS